MVLLINFIVKFIKLCMPLPKFSEYFEYKKTLFLYSIFKNKIIKQKANLNWILVHLKGSD